LAADEIERLLALQGVFARAAAGALTPTPLQAMVLMLLLLAFEFGALG
jgi:hypothetical protein